MDQLKPPDLVDRSISYESGASEYADAMSSLEDDDADFDCYDNDMCGMEEFENGSQATLHNLLYEDIERIVFLYGEQSLNYRAFETINEIDIDLNIPLGFLEEQIAEAWQLNRSEPLVLRLHLSLSTYVESSCLPKIEVFQPSKKENFGFGSQIKKITETFLMENWSHVYSNYMKLQGDKIKAKKSQSCPVNLALESKDTQNKQLPASNRDRNIARLMEFGFDWNHARNALIITRDDFDEACMLLQTDEGKCSDMEPAVQEEMNRIMQKGMDDSFSHDNGQNTKISSKTKPKPPKRQFSQPPILAQLKKMLPFSRSTSMTPSATDPGISSRFGLEDLNLMPLSTLDGKNAKRVPSLEEGFLVQLFRYVRQRIPTVNEYCVVCDEPHVFQNGAMLKPAVCSRELCVFSFQTLGVMADAAEDIATGAEVVDLLINMSRSACRSNRRNIILDPFPTVVHPEDPSNLLFSPKNKNFDGLQKIMDQIPSMQEMTGMVKGLKGTLNEKSSAIYPLLQWIITSNRSHIVKLPQENQLDFMHTPHQFLLLSSPPAKEVAFREAKEQFGSTFAFHGSSIENWHSIIRQGLKNASGTKFQVNGAAYGKGIYLSPHISTSMSYSRMGHGNHKTRTSKPTGSSDGKPRFLQSNDITCIAICEVITSKQLKKSNSIWVCPDAEHVCTRFFFVYEDGRVSDSSIDTQKDTYLRKIKSACGYKL